MSLTINKPDSIGIISSALCFVHCLATPFLFAAQAHIISCCDTASKPIWWSALDFVFLLISALAIYKSSTSVTKKWITIALWLSWSILLIMILNEKLTWLKIPEAVIYFPAISLIFFHWYSSMFCQCEKGACCVNKL